LIQTLPRMLASPWVAGILLCAGSLTQAGQAQSAPAAGLSGLAADHVTLSVANMGRESEWYERVLGFKVARSFDDNPENLVRQLRIPGYGIDLVQYKGSKRPAPSDPKFLQQGWVHIAFNVADLPSALVDLQAAKADVWIGSKDATGVPTRLNLHDPEGNEIELFKRKN
jgi:catechol-2,3-dioxygenase